MLPAVSALLYFVFFFFSVCLFLIVNILKEVSSFHFVSVLQASKFLKDLFGFPEILNLQVWILSGFTIYILYSINGVGSNKPVV